MLAAGETKIDGEDGRLSRDRSIQNKWREERIEEKVMEIRKEIKT